MAQTFSGWQPPVRQGGGRSWPWLLVGIAQLLAAGPMLGLMAGGGLVVGVMGLASGAGVGDVLPVLLGLVAGPLAGLAVPALALFSPSVRRVNRAALFALHCLGLLVGTAVAYFGWVRPAMG
ncbi:hypothetical protein ACGFZP_23455 [Kitasatospora sp. NPDC048239]|uniref:hypothetical protein n=1 Tax=Kitasatospora sp. NPDC048239 TaxID=3364046 RepID=UPI0037165615